MDVLSVGDKSDFGDLSDHFGGFLSLDLLGVDPLLHGDESGTSASLGDGITVHLPVGEKGKQSGRLRFQVHSNERYSSPLTRPWRPWSFLQRCRAGR